MNRTFVCLILSLATAVLAHAYPVQFAVTLDTLAEESDLIFKGKVGENKEENSDE